jgi:stage II sporulation protein D
MSDKRHTPTKDIFVAIVDTDTQIKIINLIDSEKYLEGVVPAEVGKDWPVESLKAQAVAARTFAWWTVLNERKTNIDFDLDDTVQYQAYSGTLNQTAATDLAVTETANTVMKYSGKVIKAYFSADSGGKTESAKKVFGEDLPYCVSKEEVYDISKTKTSWNVQFDLSEISKNISKNLKSIQVLPSDVSLSGRVDYVTLTNESGTLFKMAGTSFRQALKLRSTLFELESKIVDSKVVIEISGKGYGHGVGMTQIGARETALQLGWSFDQIVKFYYTGITLEAINHDYLE